MIRLTWGPLVALNQAHVVMQAEVGLLTREEAAGMLAALDELDEVDLEAVAASDRHPYYQQEDHVIDSVGEETGGKLHTGRSKNDLVTAVYQIVVREHLCAVVERLTRLRETLLERAAETTGVVMAAFTHNQPAQPITVAHYLLGFDHLIGRDVERLRHAFETTDRCPLGAAAIGGTGFPLDRERLAELAGFSGIRYNSYDAVSSMDFLMESANALAMVVTNLTRVASDLIDWVTYAYSYARLADEQTNPSSIMPQKRNPSSLEALRASGGEAIGIATSTMTHFKGVAFGDVGDRRYAAELPFFVRDRYVCEKIDDLEAVLSELWFDEERLFADANESFCTMTELADTMVRETGLSFRQAHAVASRLTDDAFEAGRTADEITVEDVNDAAEAVLGRSLDLDAADVADALDPERNVTRRRTVGGTAPVQNETDLDRRRDHLAEQVEWLAATRERFDEARRERRRCIDGYLDD